VTATPADSARNGVVAAIGLGLLAVVGASVLGSLPPDALTAVMQPPPLIRAALVGGFAGLGAVLLMRSVRRMAEAGQADVPGLIRGVRLAFLAVAAFAAASGWAVGHPLPVILAAIIAGVDVIETSFLLLVSRAR
jgi:hypothetical protein